MVKKTSISIRQKLKNTSTKRKIPFAQVLINFSLERLLYRISMSQYKDQFLLKGGLLFSIWFEARHRPTKDMDLLCFSREDLDYLKDTFVEICKIECDDGISFDLDSIKVSLIREQSYEFGARVELMSYLEKARTKIQIDIGFGDIVIPGPLKEIYPSLIKSLPEAHIRTYSPYTVIAEKYHVIVELGMANSRFKDYFDIYMLLKHKELDMKLLNEAIHQTFKTRNRDIPQYTPIGLTSEFYLYDENSKRWKSFLTKNQLDFIELEDVCHLISKKLIKID